MRSYRNTYFGVQIRYAIHVFHIVPADAHIRHGREVSVLNKLIPYHPQVRESVKSADHDEIAAV